MFGASGAPDEPGPSIISSKRINVKPGVGEPKSHIADRLQNVAEELYSGNKSELAREIGMKPSTFSKYATGSQPPGRSVLSRLASIGININWLLHGDGPMMAKNGEDTPKMVLRDKDLAYELEDSGIEMQRVPELRVEAEAGEGIEVYVPDEIEEDEEWLSTAFIRREYQVAPEKVRTMRVRGNSMVDTIEPGDRIRVALWDGETLWENTIYVLYGPGGLTIKRYQGVHNGHVLLTADNPNVQDREVPQDRWDDEYRPVAWALEVTQPL
jgi:phage repressor protein C with HTH and peptisase S24 domain